MKIGIDLSLRSAGLTAKNDTEIHFKLVQLKKLKEEELLVELVSNIIDFISQFKELEYINLEGLSFNSTSGSKDVIAGSFWYLRIKLKEYFPSVPVYIIPVLTWRSPLFCKEERDLLKAAKEKIKLEKKPLKGLKGEKRKKVQALNAALEEKASIKHKTFLKLPEEIKEEILKINKDDGKFDLTDAFFICNFNPTDLKEKKPKKKKPTKKV